MRLVFLPVAIAASLAAQPAFSERVSTNVMLGGIALRLDRVDDRVSIVFVRPLYGYAMNGARYGSPLFEGTISKDGGIGGRGFLYRRGCPPQPTALAGSVVDGVLILRGVYPDWEGCKPVPAKAGEAVNIEYPLQFPFDLRPGASPSIENPYDPPRVKYPVKQRVDAYELPPSNATPVAIVDFLMATPARDLAWIDDGPGMKRLLSRSLAQDWKHAASIAKSRDAEFFFEGTWLSNGLDFEPWSWTSRSTSEGVVATDMRDTAGNTYKATYRFVSEDGSWKINDVVYDSFFDPKWNKVAPSLHQFVEQEIADHGSSARAVGRTPAEKIEGLDLTKMTLEGEHETTYDHNGSEVVVFEKAGLVVYDNPKPSIAGTVKRGDVLFSGRISNTTVEGKAYTFKAGCDPAPYAVKGRWSRGSLVLTGAAPVPDKKSCAIAGYSTSSPNAHLVVKSAIGDL